MINLFLILLLCLTVIKSEEIVAKWPLQVSLKLKIIAHLVPEDSEYPPHSREMQIYYDYLNKKARVNIASGYEAEKVYIRRYDDTNEYMVSSLNFNFIT